MTENYTETKKIVSDVRNLGVKTAVKEKEIRTNSVASKLKYVVPPLVIIAVSDAWTYSAIGQVNGIPRADQWGIDVPTSSIEKIQMLLLEIDHYLYYALKPVEWLIGEWIALFIVITLLVVLIMLPG